MKLRLLAGALVLAAAFAAAAGCGGEARGAGVLSVTASTSFLADMAQNVAGDRFTVRALIPDGTDPHTYQPGPREVADVVQGDLFIANGHGLEGPLLTAIEAAGGDVTIVDASAGLGPSSGPAGDGTSPLQASPAVAQPGDDQARAVDPHFWLDPVLAKHYVLVIRDAFVHADPKGASTYRRNAAAYLDRLTALDRWARRELGAVPPTRRALVTDHQSYGYFAARYGLTVAGTILQGTSDEGTASAKHLAELVAVMRREHIPAIFVGRGENTDLADQVARETGAAVVTLLDHSLTGSAGPAPTYVAMIRYDVRQIVEALR